MTVTLTGSWQAIKPLPGTRSVIIQNPTGNQAVFVTQRITADGVDESSGDDCPGIIVAAEANLTCEASDTIWINGTENDQVAMVFFR